MAVRDLSAFFDEGLDYPNIPSKRHPEGKDYRVPSPDAKTGLWLATLANVGTKVAGGTATLAEVESLTLDDNEEIDLYKAVLGCNDECRGLMGRESRADDCSSVYHVLLEDGVQWELFKKLAQDAYLNFAVDEMVADSIMASLGKTEARPNRATRRAAVKAGRKSAPASGGTATPTPRRASSASSSRTGSAGKARKAKTA